MARTPALAARVRPVPAAATAAAVAVLACGGGGDGGQPPTQPGNTAPSASISSPTDGVTVQEGETVQFQGSADDPEDGSLTGDALVWTSDVDGQIGTGQSFQRSDLTPADHAVTLTATDSDGAEDQAGVALTVEGPGTVDGRVARTNDDSGLGGVQVTLTAAGGSVAGTTTTAADGTYAFAQVDPGDYGVSVPGGDFPALGSFVGARDTSITVGNAEAVSGVDFGFRQAEATVAAEPSGSSVAPGDVVTVTVALELNPEVPEPLSSAVGEVTWDPAVLSYVAGSASSSGSWDLAAANSSTAGTVTFSAVSAAGAAGDGSGRLPVLTFDLEAAATGSAEVAPALTELQELDTATGASTPLLADVLVGESPATVDVQ